MINQWRCDFITTTVCVCVCVCKFSGCRVPNSSYARARAHSSLWFYISGGGGGDDNSGGVASTQKHTHTHTTLIPQTRTVHRVSLVYNCVSWHWYGCRYYCWLGNITDTRTQTEKDNSILFLLSIPSHLIFVDVHFAWDADFFTPFLALSWIGRQFCVYFHEPTSELIIWPQFARTHTHSLRLKMEMTMNLRTLYFNWEYKQINAI